MIEIVPFSKEHTEGVIAVILTIQQTEFDIPITLEEQPDLLDIRGFYQQGSGNFWVSLSGGEVVGTIALRDIGNSQGALRKMFVQAPFRGSALGVARRLLQTLLQYCALHGVREVFLGTTDKFHAAHCFYEKNGFHALSKADLPATFPCMSQDNRFYQRVVEEADALPVLRH